MSFVKLYLDIDGVILPMGDNPDLQSVQWLNNLEYCNPSIIKNLGQKSLELVWCTSWNMDEILTLTKNLNTLKNGRQLELHYTIPNIKTVIKKLYAIIKDQKLYTSPFIWVDNEITPGISLIIDRRCSYPHLTISPNKDLGLCDNDLEQIEDFIKKTNFSLP